MRNFVRLSDKQKYLNYVDKMKEATKGNNSLIYLIFVFLGLICLGLGIYNSLTIDYKNIDYFGLIFALILLLAGIFFLIYGVVLTITNWKFIESKTHKEKIKWYRISRRFLFDFRPYIYEEMFKNELQNPEFDVVKNEKDIYKRLF